MDLATAALILSITTPTLYFLLILLNKFSNPTTNHCPFPNPILGNFIPFVLNYHRFLDWITDLFAASPTSTTEVRGPLGLMHGIGTANPQVVDHLLRHNFSNYIKGERAASPLSDLLGNGIFIADGHLWAVQRKTASREFTTRSLKSFIADVVDRQIRDRLIPLLSASAESKKVVDLQDVLRRFGFDNICTIAFGIDPFSLNSDGNEEQSFSAAFDEAVEISLARMFAPIPFVWKLKRYLNVGTEKRLRKSIDIINAYAAKIIALKEHQTSEKQDLLSRFIAAMDEEAENELSSKFGRDQEQRRRFLRDIVINFILAGKDSTSSGLTWFFWLLTVNPKCEQMIYDEISNHKKGDEELSYDQLKEMQYIHAAITESMRLYPPVPINGRMAVADDTLPEGTKVKAGWFADYSAYAMARREELWGEDCREYRPERWLNEKGEFVGVDSVKFPVFHSGPRTCLGREMAYVQMKAVAAAVIEKFRVESLFDVGGDEIVAPPYELMLTLRMKGGFPVRLRRRD